MFLIDSLVNIYSISCEWITQMITQSGRLSFASQKPAIITFERESGGRVRLELGSYFSCRHKAEQYIPPHC